MNDLTLYTPADGQEYFTAAELALCVQVRGIAKLPASERRMRALAEREGWNAFPERYARQRRLEGGGRPAMEYHFSILPEVLQRTLVGMARKAQIIERVTAEGEADRRKLDALRSSMLPARDRIVMEARAEILMSIEGFAAANGRDRSWAIGAFLEAMAEFRKRQEIQKRVENAQILTARDEALLTRPARLTDAEGFLLNPETLAAANDRPNGNVEVGERTIWRWFKARDERSVVALAPTPPKVQQPIPTAFNDFLRIYAVPNKPSITDAYQTYLNHVQTPGLHRMPLTLNQVKYILKNRMNNIEKNVGREGLLTLRSRMAYVTRTTEDMWPTTIYTADGKTFDAEIADPVTKRAIRPEITTVLDVVTRKIVGISLARSENQRAVAEALRNSCCGSGIPAVFYVDRGPGYRNKAMDADVGGLMGRLGITKMHAAPYGSQAKGRIERPNATVWDTLAKRLPTYIGKDRDKEAGDKVHKITRKQLKEFGESRLLPSWEDFVRLCEAMVAEYNDKPHRGLPKFQDPDTGKSRHMSPNECWAAHVSNGFEAIDVDPAEADDLFRPYEIRTARRAQVQWNGNFYFDQDLEAYHEEKVMVGYDYHQADKVWVREFDAESGQPGRLICVARFGGNSERYIPISYEQKSIEDRAKGRLRRLDDRRIEAEAERDGLLQIEAQRGEVADFIDLSPIQPEAVEAFAPIELPAPKQRRQVFTSDEELAAWALENPNDLSPNQIAVLRKCLSRPIGQENLRANGIDTEALRTLLRAVA